MRNEIDPIPQAYIEFIEAQLKAGQTPNDIEGSIRNGLFQKATDWCLWGDERWRWRTDTVCSLCGAEFAGVCGHEGDPNQEVILRRRYEARKQAVDPAPPQEEA